MSTVTLKQLNNMDELPTREIHTIKIGNHEFRTYNLTINDGSTRKTLVFILSPLDISSSSGAKMALELKQLRS